MRRIEAEIVSALAVGKPIVKLTVPDMAALHKLCDAYEGAEPPSVAVAQPAPLAKEPELDTPPLNQILYGPPGTGKTFETINAALAILDPAYLAANQADRAALRRRFLELERGKRVRFTTFHQSFSYEDFVEGIRANVDEASASNYTYSIDNSSNTPCGGIAILFGQEFVVCLELYGKPSIPLAESHIADGMI